MSNQRDRILAELNVQAAHEGETICKRCDGEGGLAEITNIPWRTAKMMGFGYWLCPDCSGSGIQRKSEPPG